MNRLLLLIIIAGITFLIVFFAMKPELIESIWLWLIGLAGVIVKGFQLLVNYFKDGAKADKADEKEQTEIPNSIPKPESKEKQETNDFKGITISILRYSDDGETTIGLLYINSKFYCYTIEDTYNEVKIPGKTRIPAGEYEIKFKEELTDLTSKFRELNPLWFTWHLWIKNVPKFNSIYIHNGGDHGDTEGCILVSDSLNISNTTTFLTNSKETFRRLYLFLSAELMKKVPVRILISDEDIITKLIC